jgi:hypothetical protein
VHKLAGAGHEVPTLYQASGAYEGLEIPSEEVEALGGGHSQRASNYAENGSKEGSGRVTGKTANDQGQGRQARRQPSRRTTATVR